MFRERFDPRTCHTITGFWGDLPSTRDEFHSLLSTRTRAHTRGVLLECESFVRYVLLFPPNLYDMLWLYRIWFTYCFQTHTLLMQEPNDCWRALIHWK